MNQSAPKEPGAFFNIIWSIVAIEILIVPVLFAIGAFDSGGKEVALAIVGLTLVAAIVSLRGTDWAAEKPIVWLGTAGLVAQLITGPFISVAFEDVEFPRSLLPTLEEPLAPWVVIVGTFGAVAVGAIAVRFRERIHERLHAVPLQHRSTVERLATFSGAWALTEFGFSLMLFTGLHPPLWNALRWVLGPLVGICFMGAALLYVGVAWKEWRDKEFKAFWESFDLSG
jgi:hypothetical protein